MLGVLGVLGVLAGADELDEPLSPEPDEPDELPALSLDELAAAEVEPEVVLDELEPRLSVL